MLKTNSLNGNHIVKTCWALQALGSSRCAGNGVAHPGHDAGAPAGTPVRPAFHAKHWHGHHGVDCGLECEELQGLCLFSHAPAHYHPHAFVTQCGFHAHCVVKWPLWYRCRGQGH